MRRVCLLSCGLAIVLAVSVSAQPSDRDALEKKALAFAQSFFEDRFDDVQKMFDDRMRAALSKDKFEEVRESVVGQFGSFNGLLGVRFEKMNVYDIVYVTCQFAQDRLDAKVVFDTARQVSGLFFVPPPPTEEYQLPVYARPSSFRDTTVTLNKGTALELEGTLSVPQAGGPFPCVILVHGSGPNDRDETLGAQKPFKDIASGLASQGIAVLRYDKRTRIHADLAAADSNFTVKEETIDDAVEAVRLARECPLIDGAKVFVLGHSLGAMVMPRIAERLPEAAGFILLAAPNRSLEEVYLTQTEYIVMLDGKMSGADSASMKAVAEAVGSVRGLKVGGPALPRDSLLGSPMSYWLDLQAYVPAQMAESITKPIFLLQGDRDYQVTKVDFSAWQKALKGKTNATLKLYPRLNHLFVEGDAKSSPADYNRPGNVAQVVVDDVAGWIKAH